MRCGPKPHKYVVESRKVVMDELRDGVVGETLGGQSGGGEAALQSLSGCCQAAVLKPR
jgi:hypothetical protein